MFVDTESLKSLESSVFEPNPESPDQRLIRKSIEEEGLLATYDTVTKDNLKRQQEFIELNGSKQLPQPDFSHCNTFSGELLRESHKLRRFPRLPPVPVTHDSIQSRKHIDDSVPKMPNHWNDYPTTNSQMEKDETESLALTCGYSLPPTKVDTTSSSKPKSSTVARRNILKIKIFTNINNEVFVIRRDRDSLQTLNELLGPIVRKLESCYQVPPSSIKLYLTFLNKDLRPVELFMGDPSSCLYSSLTEEYIHCRSKIHVLAEITV